MFFKKIFKKKPKKPSDGDGILAVIPASDEKDRDKNPMYDGTASDGGDPADVTHNSDESSLKSVLKSLFSGLPIKICLIAAAVSLIVPIISLFSASFSEYYSRTVGEAVRFVLAKITGILPFSLAETLLVAFLLFIAYCIFRTIYDSIRAIDYKKRFDVFSNRFLICIFLCALTLYNINFAAAGRRYDLADNLGLERKPLTAQQLYDCMLLVSDEISECFEQTDIRRTPDGSTCMPYSYEKLNDVLNACYRKAYKKYDFLDSFDSKAKLLAMSPIMTYTHISGIYIPYTGEVNINTNYPHYVIAFSEAHEMAHQRGLAREDEANFMAFLVMYESDDAYLRYCALTELYDYLSNALFSTDEELFYSALFESDARILHEMLGFDSFFAPYVDSGASAVMNVVNDTSIKLRGDSDGIKSYNMMVELAAAYFGI